MELKVATKGERIDWENLFKNVMPGLILFSDQ